MTLSLVHDADALPVDACGWQTPEVYRNDIDGIIAIRFNCSCGAVGGWAFGKPAAFGDLVVAAKALRASSGLVQPHVVLDSL